MNSIHTSQKTDHGWVVDIPTELTQALGIAEGSQAVLEVRGDRLEVAILPPPSPELLEEIRQTYAELKDTFAELKRHGD
jgi:bifunctional DNA-binding transcriptional regulator/antitoxin component of YhaV-PrlF toxin-antitoxin module